MAIVFGRKYLGLLLVFTTLFGGWLLALGYTVWRLHDEALEAGLGSARTYARNFEEHLTQTLQVIDLTAGSIDPLSEGKLDLVELSRRLTVALRPAPFLRSISLVGADGNIVASSSRQNIGISVDTTRFFPTVAGSETLLRVGGSWRGRDIYAGEEVSNDRPISDRDTSFVPVLRRLETKEPLWLLAAINPDYFINYSAHLRKH